jgi:hypothetical protein
MATTHPVYPDHKSADFATSAAPPPPTKKDDPKSPARTLIDAAGSPDQAKQAVDEAAREQAAPPLTEEDFARRWGFASFLEMFEASKAVGAAGDAKKWLLTALRGGKWLLWNDGDLSSAREFDSREDALPQVPRPSPRYNSASAKYQA